jgi:predicted phosphodiesterase
MLRAAAYRTVAILLLSLLALPARADVVAWVQLGGGDEISARAIVEDGGCPTLTADGAPLAMSVRSGPANTMDNVPAGTDLNKVTICEAAVPPATTSLVLLQPRSGEDPLRSELPLPPREIHRIVMFGDTGCRIKQHGSAFDLQDCNDTDAWPYQKVVTHAAAAKPDLVIHVGDYHYRESRCPTTRNCGTAFGYGYDAWNSDFFKPSQALFQAAPWIMVRGNHEDCKRAGEGWFRFLDAAPLPSACRDLTGFFVAKRGDFGFVVMDDAAAEARDDAAKAQLVAQLHDQFQKVVADIPGEAWMLSHRPVNALRYGGKDGFVSDSDIEQNAIAPWPAAIRMIVSGHIHIFETLSYGGDRPPQLVVGTGGDNLEDFPPQRIKGVDVNDARVKSGLMFTRFGYMVWDKGDTGWTGGFYDDDGRKLANCTLKSRNLACGAVVE